MPFSTDMYRGYEIHVAAQPVPGAGFKGVFEITDPQGRRPPGGHGIPALNWPIDPAGRVASPGDVTYPPPQSGHRVCAPSPGNQGRHFETAPEPA